MDGNFGVILFKVGRDDDGSVRWVGWWVLF